MSWTERLKRYRQDESEKYAKAILSEPDHIDLFRSLRFPGMVIIVGDIRAGKSGLAHRIAELMHEKRGLPCCLHLPMLSPQRAHKLQRKLPKWMKITRTRGEWGTRTVVIYDEAAQSAHARRGQSEQAVELDDLVSICGQREQLILFISHYSRKLDVNVCTAIHRIFWKRPTYAHLLWERDELSDFTMKAYHYFEGIKGEMAQKKACLVLDLDNFAFHQTKNSLPAWFDAELSSIFKDMEQNSNGKENRHSEQSQRPTQFVATR